MDIYSYLKKDHRKVDDLVEKFLENDGKKRLALFEKIKEELLIHAKTEEDSFYKALEKNKSLKEILEHADKEHDEIENCFKELSKLEFDSKEWIEKFCKLVGLIGHHTRNEEGEIFEKAKEFLSDEQAKELASIMKKLKKEPKYQKIAQA